jgi:ADP-ribose 1''-phosphate phosphatase
MLLKLCFNNVDPNTSNMIIIYTDGSRIPGSDNGGYAGIGIWFGINDHRNSSIPILEVGATNQYAELLALDYALRFTREVDSVTIKTDSKYSINCITVWNKSWQQNGWRTSKGSHVLYVEVIRRCTQMILDREVEMKSTVIEYVPGHSGIDGNEHADRLAKAASSYAERQLANNVMYFSSGILSNFHISPFQSTDYAGNTVQFGSSEQYYQYHKAVAFKQYDIAKSILRSSSTSEQIALGTTIPGYNDAIWDESKFDVMVDGLILKFSQDSNSKRYLMDTQSKHVAQAVNDAVWGIGITIDNASNKVPWKGKNLLGKALMVTREQLASTTVQMMCLNVIESTGDLFSQPSPCVLVHACNTQGSWGAGIALQFKMRYPLAFEQYHNYCVLCEVKVGTQLLIPPVDGTSHWVACLFTSKSCGRSRDSPEMILQSTRSSLQQLLQQLGSTHESMPQDVFMPRINSGMFGVPWVDTLRVLQSIRLDSHTVSRVHVVNKST